MGNGVRSEERVRFHGPSSQCESYSLECELVRLAR
jgi:hypothetical protein